MGKSKGNVIPLANIKKTYSADLFRFYIAHGADLGIYMDFRDKQIQTVRNHISRFFSFMYVNILKSQDYNVEFSALKSNTSKVALSRITNFFIESGLALEEFNQRRYLQISFYEVFNLIQEFKKFTENEEEFYIVFKLIYPNWLKLLSLAIPHLTEELWQISGESSFISNEACEEWDEKYIDEELENDFKFVSTIIEDIHNIVKVVKTNDFDKIYLYTAPQWKYEVNQVLISNKGNLKSTIEELKKRGDLLRNKQVIPFIKSQIKARVWNILPPKKEEKDIIKDYIQYIEIRLGKTIILNSEYDPKNKANKAIPLKPAIFIDI